MKYILIAKQEGEGCGYSIGCGIQVLTLNATDMQSAIAAAEATIRENYYLESNRLENADILAIADVHGLDLRGPYQHMAVERAAERSSAKEQQERAEFERLAKKYGPK